MAQVAVGAARQYCEQLFGGPIDEQESNPTAQTTVGTLVNGNGDRVGLVVVNQGANPIYISTNSGVSATNGILLAAAGGFLSMDVTRDFTLPSRQWFFVATGGTSACYVMEILRYGFTPAQ